MDGCAVVLLAAVVHLLETDRTRTQYPRMKTYESLAVALSITLASMPVVATAAGNVRVRIDGGDLSILGQNKTPQSILISARETPGSFRISSLDGTTFNGEPSLVVNGVTGDVDIDLRSGPKTVVLSGDVAPTFQVPRNLDIDNQGRDRVLIILDRVVVAGETDITTKGGSDAIIVHDSLFNRETDINTGGGNNVVEVREGTLFSGEFEFQAGSGSDHLIMFDSGVLGEIDARTGSGNDVIAVYSSMIADGDVIGGSGFDRFEEDTKNGLLSRLDFLSVESRIGDANIDATADVARLSNPAYDDVLDLFDSLALD